MMIHKRHLRPLLVCGVVLYGALALAESPDIANAVVELRDDIARDTEALITLREEIADLREPLAEKHEELSRQAAGLRAEQERVQRLRQQGEEDLARLEQRAAQAKDSVEYVQNLLTEYARSAEVRMTSAEAAAFGDDFRDLREHVRESDASNLASLAEELLGHAYAWNEKRTGGHTLSGTALDGEGIAREGRFAIFGPSAFFAASDEPKIGGIAISRTGRLEPGLYDLGSEQRADLLSLLDGQEARVSVDLTGGDAIRLSESRVHYLARLQQGGFVMIPLLLTGLVALVLAVWKGVALWRLHRAIRVDVRAIVSMIREGHVEKARSALASIQIPLSDVLSEALENRQAPREHLEEILHEHVVNVLPQAERHLGMLAVLGGVAPLLGLLGTVTGMIHTFQLVTLFGSGDARMLSGGISEALVTTETGLIIAVPVLLVQAGLARWARSVVAELERQAISIVNGLHVRATKG